MLRTHVVYLCLSIWSIWHYTRPGTAYKGAPRRAHENPLPPLHEAIRFGAHDWVSSLLESGYVENNTIAHGRTALGLAIESNDLRLIRAVLSMGGSPTVHRIAGEHVPSLILALKSYRLMLGRIANVMIRQVPTSELKRKAGGRVLAEVLKICEFQRAKTPQKKCSNGISSLEGDILLQDIRNALDQRVAETISLLIENGADIEKPDGAGETPLIVAARLGFHGAVDVLLENGANLLRANAWGLTPKMIAETQGFSKVLDVLTKERSEDVLTEDQDGCFYRMKSGSVMTAYQDDPMLNQTYIDTVLVQRLPLLVKAKRTNHEEKPRQIEKPNRWNVENLLKKFGGMQSRVSNIPYGSVDTTYITLEDYVRRIVPRQAIDQSYENAVDGGIKSRPPLYWFAMLHPKDPIQMSAKEQLGKPPPFILHSPLPPKPTEEHANYMGYQAGTYQLFYGSRATGSPQHMHDPSWNYLAKGKKKWFFWSPGKASYSTVPPIEAIATWESNADSSCIQEAGDFLLVPEDWGHATYGLEEHFGMAIEYTHRRIGAHSTLYPPPPIDTLRLEPIKG